MKYLFVLGLMICSLFTDAQPLQNHFVYLQTENRQPFYVKINNDILSSTASGYLIVPKLGDSTYQFIIGFPANEWSEQNVTLAVKKDAGFLLKNFQEKGWGLFNLQTFEVVMNGNKADAEPEKVITSSDQFSTMLSEVVNDSSILKTTVSKEIKQPQSQAKNDSSVIVAPAPIVDDTTATKSLSIEKLISKTDDAGLQITYFDQAEKDTINTAFDLLIENDPKIYSSTLTSVGIKEQDSATIISDTSGSNIISPTNQLGEKSTGIKKDSSNQVEFLDAKKTSIVNSNCRQIAVQADVQKLQRKMLTESSDDEKIKVAKKIFKAKCFATEYVRHLSRLFLTSAGKYNFFDMAYPYTSDSGLYYTLESELLDAYYIKRFQALINK